jgi:LmbE family N-acetylglucosaminyl deacetylase
MRVHDFSILSPHRDDVALSLGLTLDALLRAGASVEIINCYTISNYAPETLLTDSKAISDLRRREDCRFYAALHSAPAETDLCLLDAPLRRGIVPSATRAPQESSDADDREALELVSAVRNVATGNALLLPLALGNHIDHGIVLRAGCVAGSQLQLGFYEDLPYAIWTSEDSLHAVVTHASELCGRKLTPVVVRQPNAVRLKRTLIGVYTSQYRAAMFDTIAEHSLHFGGERLWADDLMVEYLTRRIGEVTTMDALADEDHSGRPAG